MVAGFFAFLGLAEHEQEEAFDLLDQIGQCLELAGQGQRGEVEDKVDQLIEHAQRFVAIVVVVVIVAIFLLRVERILLFVRIVR